MCRRHMWTHVVRYHWFSVPLTLANSCNVKQGCEVSCNSPVVFKCVCVRVCECFYVDGAAEQWAEFQSLPHDVKQEGRSFVQVVALWDSSGEILKTLDTRTSGQSLVRAVHPAGDTSHLSSRVTLTYGQNNVNTSNQLNPNESVSTGVLFKLNSFSYFCVVVTVNTL